MKASIQTHFFLIFLFTNITLLFGQNHKNEIAENIFIEKNNKKYGVVNSLNEIIIPFIYDFIEYKNSVLIVTKGKNSGILSVENKEVVPLKFQHILLRNNNRFILWTKNSEFGLCDYKGKIILPVSYKSVSSNQSDDFYLTENNNGYFGVYDINGNNIFP